MSQDYHHHHHQAAGFFSFSNGFERSAISHQEQQQLQLAQQIRRDKLRVQGFEPPPPPLVGIEEEESNALPVYEHAGMLSSEIFYFPSGVAAATAASSELLDQADYRGYSHRSAGNTNNTTNEWYSNRQGVDVGDLRQLGTESKSHNNNHDSLAHKQQHQQLPSSNADSAAAMHLFLMNRQPKSPSPPPPQTQPPSSSLQGFNVSGLGGAFPSQFTWVPDSSHESETGGTVVEGQQGQGQGLSLSLSPLQHLEAAKAEELMFYNQDGGSSATATPQFQYKNLGGHHQQPSHQTQNHQVHVGYNSSLGTVNVLRNSKYVKEAQELLEEFCSVGRGQFKKKKFGRNKLNPSIGDGSPSSIKDLPPLSAADRIEHQRRKVKLLAMLDEVDRRYNHYCEQMQTVVNSFDLVMGFGAAVPYTALAQKAMSRHFRCLKDAITAQLMQCQGILGEKDGAGASGITKGETPRLKMLEQNLRQQKAFQPTGMMEHEAWRPQRGLPERSVNILRAWLFDHFLHPYPSDADKQLLARQTGLSRNQVSNWFINARVRLWKPMVEEMYQQESKDDDDDGDKETRNTKDSNNNAQTSTPPTATVDTAGDTSPPPTTTPSDKISEINAIENDPSFIPITSPPPTTRTTTSTSTEGAPPVSQPFTDTHDSDIHQRLLAGVDYGTTDMGSTLIRFGTTAGDVSLTLGLRHAGNMPTDKTSSFSVTDFGGC